MTFHFFFQYTDNNFRKMNIKYLFNDFPFQEPVLITFVAELSFSTKANNIEVLNIVYISL